MNSINTKRKNRQDAKVKVKDDLKKAKEAAFRLLKFRGRSENEIRERLRRKKISPEVVEEVIEYLKAARYLNDYDFAWEWTRSRINRPLGIKRIAYELKQKRITQDIIQQVTDKIKEGYDEQKVVSELLQEKIKKAKGLDKDKFKRRLFNFLLRRGFSPDTVIEAMEKIKP